MKVMTELQCECLLEDIEKYKVYRKSLIDDVEKGKHDRDDVAKLLESSDYFWLVKQQAEVDAYRNAKLGIIPDIPNLNCLGSRLIAARITAGLSQAQLAKKVGLSLSDFEKLELNEYYGVKIEFIQIVIDAIGFEIKIELHRNAKMLI